VRAVVQRVRDCSVAVGGRIVGAIGHGLLVYLGVGRADTPAAVPAIVDKIVHLRIFVDEAGKMNRSVKDTSGSVLVVPQFTLYGDVRDGRRPSYTGAAEPAFARELYEAVMRGIAAEGVPVSGGEFAARMEVSYVNEGPVTILVDTEKTF
jgi:D-tyrosyl-tRNA(Tyr) deacylase